MIRIQDFLCLRQITLDAGFFAPRQRQHPIQIIANNRRFRGHRAHVPQLLEFSVSLLTRFSAQFRALQRFFKLR